MLNHLEKSILLAQYYKQGNATQLYIVFAKEDFDEPNAPGKNNVDGKFPMSNSQPKPSMLSFEKSVLQPMQSVFEIK